MPPKARQSEVLYTKFQLSHFSGVKQAVFLPAGSFDAKMAGMIWKTLKLNRPNLVIEGMGSGYHPFYMLDDSEVTSKSLSALRKEVVTDGLGPEESNNIVRECLMMKIKSIVNAILAAVEQTGSATWHPYNLNQCELLMTACVKSGSVKVDSIASMHACDARCTKESVDLLNFLLDNAVDFNESQVAAFGEPKKHSGSFLVTQSLSKPFEGHGCDDVGKNGLLPEDKRQPDAIFVWPEADLFLIQYDDRDNDADGNINIKQKPYGYDYSASKIEKSVLAPPGHIFIGGRSNVAKNQIMLSFERAIPSVIINHSGGHANVFGELVTAIAAVIHEDLHVLKQLVPQAQQSQLQKTLKTQDRLALISPGLLFHYTLKKASQDKIKGDAVRSQVTLVDVSQILDLAKTRPQVFTETIKVVHPLKDTPEECLERFSACFSSVYTGVTELGGSAAQADVVLQAWRVHKSLAEKKQKLRTRSTMMMYLSAVLGWLAIVLAVIIQEFHSCETLKVNAEERDPVASHRSLRGGKENKLAAPVLCGILNDLGWNFLLAETKYLEVMIVVVPLLSGLIGTVASTFMFHEKWAMAELACAQIARECHLFRGGVGPYSVSSHSSSENAEEETDTDELSPAAKAKKVRMRFVAKIAGIRNSLVSSNLKDDHIDAKPKSSLMLRAEQLPAYTVKALYGEEVPTKSVCLSVLSCACCCARRKKTGKKDSQSNSSLTAVAVQAHDEEDMGETLLDDETTSLVQSEADNADVDPDGPLEGMDDCLAAFTTEVYFQARLQKLLGMYARVTPTLAQQYYTGTFALFLCSFIASLLGAFKHSNWIPVALGFAAMLTAIIQYHAAKPKLLAMNQAVQGLCAIEVQWAALSNVDRRTPNFKSYLITQTEQLAFTVVQASVGSGALAASTGSGAEDQPEDNEDSGSKKKTDKNKSSDKKKE